MKPATLLFVIFLVIASLSCNKSSSANHTDKKPDVPKRFRMTAKISVFQLRKAEVTTL
jgi:hypothetical protein